LKWLLRFHSQTSRRLSRKGLLARQVRAHRVLTRESAQALLALYDDFSGCPPERQQFVSLEGKKSQTVVSKRERDPEVRRRALEEKGRACMVCGSTSRLSTATGRRTACKSTTSTR